MEFLNHDFYLGLCIGAVLGLLGVAFAVIRLRDTKGEVRRLRMHLANQLELEADATNRLRRDLADARLMDAQARAFGTAPQGEGQNKTETLQLPDLFAACSYQIEVYESQTRNRANWSFSFAVVAMLAGILLLCWGAFVLFQVAGGKAIATHHIISGSIISTVGCAMSAYITKTFLDVHRTSLLQLNHYFKQPVLTSHILTAERLANQLDDKVKEEMYRDLIQEVVSLISAEQAQSAELSSLSGSRVSKATKRGSGRGRKPQMQGGVDDDQHRESPNEAQRQ